MILNFKMIILAFATLSNSLSFANEGTGVYINPRAQFEKLSQHKKQIWVVGYTNGTLDEALHDAEITFANGGDAIVFEGGDYKKLDSVLAAARAKFPDKVIGVNYLGATISYIETFELAKKNNLQIAWTDYSGIDQVEDAPEISLHHIDESKPKGVFYVSGIHMKYLTLKNPNKSIEQSARQAMGWMDGICITGPATGHATNPEKAKRARAAIGDYPMGAASGVSPENAKDILPYIDYALVNSAISTKEHRIIPERLQALRKVFDAK